MRPSGSLCVFASRADESIGQATIVDGDKIELAAAYSALGCRRFRG